MSLTIADAASVSGAPAVAAEMCECPWGYSGTSCEVSVSLKKDGWIAADLCRLCRTTTNVCVFLGMSARFLQSGWRHVWRQLYAVRV